MMIDVIENTLPKVKKLGGMIRRPILRYYGGKWKISQWVNEYLPNHKTYVEPFGGAASVLLRKSKSLHEIYNDLDEDLWNLFRVVRDVSMRMRLIESCQLTPFSRREFELSWEIVDDPVEMARKLLVRSWFAYGGLVNKKTGFRFNSLNHGKNYSHDWRNLIPMLNLIGERMESVTIECKSAFELIPLCDTRETLFYVDPPYTVSSEQYRESVQRYKNEFNDEQQAQLADLLKGVQGMVVLSGYRSQLYVDLYPGWKSVEQTTYVHAGPKVKRKSVEVLWFNDAAVEALSHKSMMFSFGEVA